MCQERVYVSHSLISLFSLKNVWGLFSHLNVYMDFGWLYERQPFLRNLSRRERNWKFECQIDTLHRSFFMTAYKVKTFSAPRSACSFPYASFSESWSGYEYRSDLTFPYHLSWRICFFTPSLRFTFEKPILNSCLRANYYRSFFFMAYEFGCISSRGS